MGPKATGECFSRIIEKTPAKKDQDHIPILIYNIPQVPDRTKAILHDGEDPLPILKCSAQKLEKAGADFIIIHCNTAHYFIEDIQNSINIPILNMVESTIDKISSESEVGLLATSGTIETGIYQDYAKNRMDIITPDEKYQEIFMEVIYGEQGVKAGYYNEKLTKKMLQVVNNLERKGPNNIIAGCTEVRLVLEHSDLEEITLLKPIDIISEKAIKFAFEDV